MSIVFEENTPISRSKNKPHMSGLVSLLVNYGLAKNANVATMILGVVALILIVVALFIFIFKNNQSYEDAPIHKNYVPAVPNP